MLVLWMTGTQRSLSFAPKLIHSSADKKILEEQGLGELAFIVSHGYSEEAGAIGSFARRLRIEGRRCGSGCPSAPLSPALSAIHSGG